MTPTLYTRLLRWAFTRFYREFAWTYDLVAALVSRGLWRHWIEAVAPQLRGSRVLEIGCGTGYLQRALRRQGLDSYGLDASPQMLRLAQGKMERAGLSGRLVRGYAQHLPFPSEHFSDVVATFPAEYILAPETMREIWRVLQPSGQVVLVDSAVFSKQDTYSAVVDVAYRVTQQVRSDDPRPRLLQMAGFKVHETWVDVQQSRIQLLYGIKQVAE